MTGARVARGSDGPIGRSLGPLRRCAIGADDGRQPHRGKITCHAKVPSTTAAPRPRTRPDIAQVHVDGWQRAHEELVPEEYLAASRPSARGVLARGARARGGRPQAVGRARCANVIIGFADGGIARDDDLDAGTGEVYTLFVTPECWEQGIRSNLVEHVARDLRGARLRARRLLGARRPMRSCVPSPSTSAGGRWHTPHSRTAATARSTELRYARDLV